MVHNLTNQEVFDKSAKHLLAQGCKSVRKASWKDPFTNCTRYGTKCQYRGPKGLMCALGPFIPNGVYAVHGEDITVDELPHEVPELAEADDLLLENLQDVHDNHHPNAWRKQLRKVAEGHELSTTVLEE